MASEKNIKKVIEEYLATRNDNSGTTVKLRAILALYNDPDRKCSDVAATCCCWKSLAYCCATPKARSGFGKECLFRDAAIDLLGLAQQEFEQLKDEHDEAINRKSQSTKSSKKGKKK